MCVVMERLDTRIDQLTGTPTPPCSGFYELVFVAFSQVVVCGHKTCQLGCSF